MKNSLRRVLLAATVAAGSLAVPALAAPAASAHVHDIGVHQCVEHAVENGASWDVALWACNAGTWHDCFRQLAAEVGPREFAAEACAVRIQA